MAWLAVASTDSRPAWRMTTGIRGKTTWARLPITFVARQDSSSGGQRNSPTAANGVVRRRLTLRVTVATSAATWPPSRRLVAGARDHVDVVGVRGRDELVRDAVEVDVADADRVEAEVLAGRRTRDRPQERAVRARGDLH